MDDMTRYQEKLQEVRDAKKAKKELEFQAEEEKRLAERRAAEKAALERREALKKEAEESEKVLLKQQELETEQINTFQDFVEKVCRKNLDHILATGEFEISETRECGFFKLKFNLPGDDYTLDLHRCAKVWNSRSGKDKTIRVSQDPRINFISIHIHDHGRYKSMQIYVQHGDPEEWQSNIPRASVNGHDGGYRSASESADIEYHRGSADTKYQKGYAASIRRWKVGIDESVANFFLDQGFFGGRK